MGVALCGGARKWVWHCVVEQGSGCGIVWWSKEVGVTLWWSKEVDVVLWRSKEVGVAMWLSGRRSGCGSREVGVAGGRWVWQEGGGCGRREVGVAGGRWVWQDEGECRHDRHKVWQATTCDQS